MAKALMSYFVIGTRAIGTERWSTWKSDYGVTIPTHEEEYRFKVFEANAAFVDVENRKNHPFTLALNEFSHLSNEEFQQMFTGSKAPNQEDSLLLGTQQVVGVSPKAVDWRNHSGVLQPIKNQGSCASCWAFAATAAVESGFAISTGQSVSLSEQQLIDCDNDCRNCTANPSNPEHKNGGCAGGWPSWAFNFMENVSLCTETSYPYTGTDPQTNLNNCSATTCEIGVPAGAVKGFMAVNQSYVALNEAVAQQPVAVSVNANAWWQFYSGGVLDGSGGCSGSTNHAITVVGYAPSTDSRYDFQYIARNSWGASWGEAGYVRIPSIYHYAPQDPTKYSPSCLLLVAPTYPVIGGEIVV